MVRRRLLLLPAIILWVSGIALPQAPTSPLLKDLRLDPNELDRAITQLVQKLRGAQSEGERQKPFDEERPRLLKMAENESQRQEIARRIENVTSFDPEAGAGMGGGMRESQGMMAGPGVYRITLSVAGKTCTTTLAVRMDPLLDEMSKKQ
jgi:hypothetical protein